MSQPIKFQDFYQRQDKGMYWSVKYNAVIAADLLECSWLSIWQVTVRQTVLGGCHLLTQEPEELRQSESLPKARTRPDMSRTNHVHSYQLQSTLVIRSLSSSETHRTHSANCKNRSSK